MAKLKTNNPLMLGIMFIFLFSTLSLGAARGKEKTGNEGKDKKGKKVQKVQPAKTMNEQVFTQNMFEKLPKGRDFLSIVTLVPGVNYEQLLGGVSIDGASGAENRYYIEGVDTTTQYTGESGMRVNFDFIEEVRVRAAGISAESTGSTGGVIRVKTRGGGNEFHGTASFYFESSALTGKPRETLRVDPLDQDKADYVAYPKDKWHSIEPGFTLGGPIIKDKLWFFAGVMPRFKTTTRNGNHWPAPNLSTGERISTIFGGENHFSGSNLFTGKDTYYAGLLKFTGQPLKNLRFSIYGLVDYYKWKGELPPVDGSGEPNRDYAPIAYEYPKLSIGGSIDYTVSDRLSLSLTGGYYRSNERELAAPDLPFKIHMTSNEEIPGIPPEFVTPRSSIYLRYAAPQLTKNIQDTLSGAFDLSYYFNLVGQHSVKAGVQVVRTGIDKDADIPRTYKRFYWGRDYGHVDGPITPTTLGYIEVREPWGIEAKVHSARLAVYLQDSWTICDRLTLDLGLRAEKEDIPAFTTENATPIRWNFGDKLAPRIGFSYNMLKDSSLQIFGSFGVYYDIMKLALAEKYYGGFKWLSHYYDIVNWDWKNGFPEATHPQPGGYAGGRYFETINWREVSFANTQPDIKPFRKNEFTFGVRKTLNEDWTVSGRFLYNYIVNAVEDIGVLAGGSEFYYCGNPGSAWIQAWYQGAQDGGFMPGGVKASRAIRRYTSAAVHLDRKFKNNWFGGFSYTWSRLYGNYSGLAGSDEEGRNAPGVLRYFDNWFQGYNQYGKEELGLLRTDRPHQFKIYGAYVFDFGLTLGCSAYAMSGVPLQTEIYVNNLKGFYPLGRGSAGRTPWLWQIDLYAEYNLKLSDTFTLQLNANVTNLTDNDMARNRYMLYNDANINLPEAYFLSGFDYIRVIAEKGAHLDPRYNKAYDYLDPIAARLGVKLMF
ncbi:MAG: hypothetical protein NT166_19825 [Candidatus Aminicenantes bacterium]|nr:hypothetical protein [Candidatus Aminicenantes bacterium]